MGALLLQITFLFSLEEYLLIADYYFKRGELDSSYLYLDSLYREFKNPVFLREKIKYRYSARDFDNLIKEGKNFLKKYEDTLVVDLVARSLVAKNRDMEALRFVEKYRKKYYKIPGFKQLLGNLYELNKKYDEALKIYRELFSDYPDSLRFYRDYISLLVKTKNYQKADSLRIIYMDKFPPDYKVYLTYGAILEFFGKFEEAYEFFYKAYSISANHEILLKLGEYNVFHLSKIQEGIEILEGLKKNFPTDKRVRKTLGIAYYMLDNIPLALDNLLSSMAIDTLDPHETYYYLARCLMRVGEQIKALDFIKKAYKIQNKKEYALYLAFTYLVLDSLGNAMEVLIKDPQEDSPHWHSLLATVYNLMGRKEDALYHFKRAFELDSLNPVRKRDLAQIYLDLKIKIEAFKILWELWEEKKATREDLITLAILASDMGFLNKSIDIYRFLVERDTSDHLVYNNWGYTLALYGVDLEFALELLKKALSLSPDNPVYLDSIAWIYYRMGDYKNAYFYIKKALERGVKDEEILRHYREIKRAYEGE